MQMMYEIKGLTKCAKTRGLHFHITSASPFSLRTHSHGKIWHLLPACREFNFQILPNTKEPAKANVPCTEMLGRWKDRGRPPPAWGQRLMRAPRRSGAARGRGTRAALKMAAASPLPGRGLLGPRTGCPPCPSRSARAGPTSPGSVHLPAEAEVQPNPLVGTFLKRPRRSSPLTFI